MSSVNPKRRPQSPSGQMPVPLPMSSELPAPSKVRWVEGDALDREAWHQDWDDDDLVEDDLEIDPGFDEYEDGEDAERDEDLDGEGEDEAEAGYDSFFEDSEENEESAADPASEGTSESANEEANEGPNEEANEEGNEEANEEGNEEANEEAVAAAGDEDADEAHGRKRSKTIARKQMLRERRRMLAQGTIPEIMDYDRPVHRADCRDAKRPCLYVSCRYHLYLDVNPITGSIKLNFPDKEVWDLEETCALDVAERGGITLEEVGEIMNLTRERIRQVEVSGLEKLKNGEVKLHTFIDGRELQLEPFEGRRGLPIIDK